MKFSFQKKILAIAIILFAYIASCSKYDPTRGFDSETGMSRNAIESALTRDAMGKDKIEASIPPIPRLSKIISVPSDPKINEEKIVSVSATDDIPLIDLLIEIGRVANMDVVVDKNLSGGLFLNIKNRPLYEVLDRICEMADLRYTEVNGIATFEYDDPYLVTYNVNFLNLTRTSSSSSSVSSSVSSGGISSGSSASLSTSGTDTFWTDLESNIKQIISSATQSSDTKRRGNVENIAKRSDSSSSSSLSSSSSQSSNQSSSQSTNISLNKGAGTINIYTNSVGHKKIEKYLANVRKRVSAQVLIEVKLAEVQLSKNFENGIDFSYLKNEASKTFSISDAGLSSIGGASGVPLALKLSRTTNDGASITSALNLLDYFGTTKVLSSPRVTAINNQQVILTIADNEIYFNISMSATAPVMNGNQIVVGSQATVTSTPVTVPIGIILTLQPSIDPDRDTVMLNVKPTISRLKELKEDPAFTYQIKKANISDVPANKIPVTSTREIDSIISMKSGDIVVMGGFTERNSIQTETGIPILNKIPLIGWFFSRRSDLTTTKEVILLLKATIIGEKNEISEYDKFFYKSFFRDPRELSF